MWTCILLGVTDHGIVWPNVKDIRTTVLRRVDNNGEKFYIFLRMSSPLCCDDKLMMIGFGNLVGV